MAGGWQGAGAVLFSLALNHKQMAMYFAPAFFAHLLGWALQHPSPRGKVLNRPPHVFLSGVRSMMCRSPCCSRLTEGCLCNLACLRDTRSRSLMIWSDSVRLCCQHANSATHANSAKHVLFLACNLCDSLRPITSAYPSSSHRATWLVLTLGLLQVPATYCDKLSQVARVAKLGAAVVATFAVCWAPWLTSPPAATAVLSR